MLKERDSARSKAFLKATIRFQNRNVTMDCVVRNISLSGARLEISQGFTLPTEFELEIPQRGAVFQCELKWRKEDAAGVRFKDSLEASISAPSQPAATVVELQQENARLRQELARLSARLQQLES